VAAIAWWAVASHATHLILAAGLCVLLSGLLVFRRPPSRRRLLGVGEAAMIVLLGAASNLALHAYLYGKPSLNGERPPFLMARVIADGPGRWYLEQHCGEARLAICEHVHDLPDNPDDFLWAPQGIWQSASAVTVERLREEETPFVLATLRAYPREQLAKSVSNFRQQLTAFGLWDLGPSDWIAQTFDEVLPNARSHYLQSRQGRDVLPFDLFSSVQDYTVILSIVVIGVLLPLALRRHSPRVAGLSVVIVSMVIANAFVTGALSMVEDRFQCRVIWLLPLLAGVLALQRLLERSNRVIA
jgi:hypothetical protein